MILKTIAALTLLPIILNAQTIGFFTRDNSSVYGSCLKTDTDPAKCSVKIQLILEFQDSPGNNISREFCWALQGMYPYDETSLHPMGLMMGARFVVVDSGPLSNAIVQFSLKGTWSIYDVQKKQWLKVDLYPQEIRAALQQRATKCTFK